MISYFIAEISEKYAVLTLVVSLSIFDVIAVDPALDPAILLIVIFYFILGIAVCNQILTLQTKMYT